jgi:hypothetical protein
MIGVSSKLDLANTIISKYPPLDYLTHFRMLFITFIEPLDSHQWEQRIIRRRAYLMTGFNVLSCLTITRYYFISMYF